MISCVGACHSGLDPESSFCLAFLDPASQSDADPLLAKKPAATFSAASSPFRDCVVIAFCCHPRVSQRLIRLWRKGEDP